MTNPYSYSHLPWVAVLVLCVFAVGICILGVALFLKRKDRWTAGGVLVVGVLILLGTWYNSTEAGQIPIVFSEKVLMDSLWQTYKNNYIEKTSGRTLDPSRGSITTSEGEAYTMLRAVWQDDKETFDTSWQWTKDNLRHKTDPGISWLFGKNASGTYAVLTDQGGQHSASDADTDIALALVFAYSRWHQPTYQGDAGILLKQIWDQDVVVIQGKPYLAASDSEKVSPSPTVAINPSYFSPYAYKVFATVDPAHNWKALADSSYELLSKVSAASLDVKKSANLPPDWVLVDRVTGAISPVRYNKDATSNYGFDAFRTSWRIALDWQWNEDPRAETYLRTLGFLSQEWETNHRILGTYTHAGTAVSADEYPASYGADLGYFIVEKPAEATEIYRTKLQFLYNPDTDSWKQKLSYYDDNWAWFGIGLYNKLLPNLYKP